MVQVGQVKVRRLVLKQVVVLVVVVVEVEEEYKRKRGLLEEEILFRVVLRFKV